MKECCCIECGKSYICKRHTKYCSDACRQRYKYKAKKAKGFNPYSTQKERGLSKKIEAVLAKGGKCEVCGYDKNLSALEFHHTNPKDKKFQVDLRVFSNLSLDRLNEEINKCMLLCANCHREVHNPDKNNWLLSI